MPTITRSLPPIPRQAWRSSQGSSRRRGWWRPSTACRARFFSACTKGGGANRPSLVYCGDDKRAKALAVTLIQDAGFAPVDAGPARIARYIEPFALLVAQLAYEGKGGPELAYRFERFGK